MKRNYYPMKHFWATTMQMGKITPIFRQEVTPLDTWSGNATHVGRMSPLNKPVFGEIDYDAYYFFVPYEYIYNMEHGDSENFSDVITGKDTSFTWPAMINSAEYQDGNHTLFQAFGVGQRGTLQGAVSQNAMALRAYSYIYNKWFVDPEAALEVDITTNEQLLYASRKQNDYLTAAQDDVELGAQTTVDSSGATIGVPEIKDAFAEQRLAEIRERFGTEYDDHLRMMGVNTAIKADKKPELIAYGGTKIGISEVLVTATSASENSGEYVGHGMFINRVNVKPKMFKEYGSIIGVAVARPISAQKDYHDRWFQISRTAYDGPEELYNPILARKSHESVLAGEISSKCSSASYEAVWGYMPKYEWLRHARNVVAGDILVKSTYNDEFLLTEDTDAGGVSSIGAMIKYLDTEYNYLFQDSTQPHFKLYCANSIGKRSQILRSGVGK